MRFRPTPEHESCQDPSFPDDSARRRRRKHVFDAHDLRCRTATLASQSDFHEYSRPSQKVQDNGNYRCRTREHTITAAVTQPTTICRGLAQSSIFGEILTDFVYRMRYVHAIESGTARPSYGV